MPIIRQTTVKHVANTIKDAGTNPSFAFFLGAGASHQSGIIIASEMVKFFKERIFEEECPERLNTDEEKESWLREQEWYKTEGSEYGKCFEHFAAKETRRRRYIESIIEGKEPSFGYVVLANLLASNYINTIITTNFDDLVYSACTSYTGLRPIVHAYGNFASEMRITAQRPKILKLHGDYLYKVLNTETEIARQDPNMVKQVTRILSEYGLIVIGYGGGDKSIMDILSKFSEDNDLYWCVMRGSQPNERVKGLLEDKGGFIVEIEGFDQMMNEVRRIAGIDVTKMLTLGSYLDRQDQFIEKVKGFKDQYRIDILSEFVEALNGQLQMATEEQQRIENTIECLNHYTEALKERRVGNNSTAEKLFYKVIEKDPKFKVVNNDLGIIHLDVGDNDAAEADFRKEIEINPEGIHAYGNLVLLLRRQGRNDEAQEIADQALRYNALSFRIVVTLIAKYKGAENNGEADKYETEAHNLIEPNDYYRLAVLQCVAGNVEAAIENLKRDAKAKGDKFDRDFAKQDPDFELIRDDLRFNEIIGGQM
jgi:SIR2-like domain/Tetratricopeptide repeat